MQTGQDAGCAYCGAEIAAAQRSLLPHCGAPLCAARHGKDVQRQRAEGKRARVQVQAAQMAREQGARLDGIAAQQGVAREALLLGPVPHRRPKMEPLSEALREEFIAHSEAVLAAAFAVPAGDIAPSARRADGAAQEPSVVSPACATCRGKCCQMGRANMAFVKVGMIQAKRLERPGLTAEDFRAVWAAHLPEEIAAGACVFNGAMGCTLPRDWRAYVCNAYHCEALEVLIEDVAAQPERPVALAGITEEGEIALMAMMSPEGEWEEIEA